MGNRLPYGLPPNNNQDLEANQSSDDHMVENRDHFLNPFPLHNISEDEDFDENDEVFGLQTIPQGVENALSSVSDVTCWIALVNLNMESVSLLIENEMAKIQFSIDSTVECEVNVIAQDKEIFSGNFFEGFNQMVVVNDINLSDLLKINLEAQETLDVVIILNTKEKKDSISQIKTYATIIKTEFYSIKVNKQIAIANNITYNIYDIYGAKKHRRNRRMCHMSLGRT